MLISNKVSITVKGIHLFTPNNVCVHQKRNGKTTVIIKVEISAEQRDWAIRSPHRKSPI